MRILFALVAAVFALPGMFAAVRGGDIMYVGGTVTAVPEQSKGKLDVSSDTVAVFQFEGGSIAIPFKTISSIEYGQKAGRRVGVALAISPIALFSKKRKHYLSLAYVDDQGNKQGAVFECAKGKVHALIVTLETRSGKKVEFESEDAKKNFEKEGK